MSVPATVVDAEFKETGSALAPSVSWTPSFAVAVDDAIARKAEKRRFFENVMDADLHYGVIPGTGTKPTLLKPGAEMLLSNMGLNATFIDAESPIVDVLGKDHGGEAYIRYRRICRIYRQLGAGENERMIVAEAGGSCSSWETKYRYRNDQRKCPECGKPAIIKGKEEYGGGFVCFKKKDGCGAKFKENDPAIIGQAVGKVANPDVAELENTILKMADKRALVAATLIATGCSDIFTQDVEDAHDAGAGESPERAQEPENRPRSDDGPPRVSKSTVDKIFAAFARIGADEKTENELLKAATGGTVALDNIAMLTVPQAKTLSALIAAEEAKRPEPVQCPECTGLDGEHLDDELGPCINDHSPRAVAIQTDEIARERHPELHQPELI